MKERVDKYFKEFKYSSDTLEECTCPLNVLNKIGLKVIKSQKQAMKNVVLLLSAGDHDEGAKIGIMCTKAVKDADEVLESIKGEFEDCLSKIVEIQYKGSVPSSKLETVLKKLC